MLIANRSAKPRGCPRLTPAWNANDPVVEIALLRCAIAVQESEILKDAYEEAVIRGREAEVLDEFDGEAIRWLRAKIASSTLAPSWA